MPYWITTSGDIRQYFSEFEDARKDLVARRALGQKPRIYYGTSFDCPGCELDEEGQEVPEYLSTTWPELYALLPDFESPWSIIDKDLSNRAHIHVDIYASIDNRTCYLAQIVYMRETLKPLTVLLDTLSVRIAQGVVGRAAL